MPLEICKRVASRVKRRIKRSAFRDVSRRRATLRDYFKIFSPNTFNVSRITRNSLIYEDREEHNEGGGI